MPAPRRSFPFPPTPHTLGPSRPDHLQKLDTESQSYSMAYPFPRFGSAPQTPQHVPEAEKSLPMTRSTDSTVASKRTSVVAFVVIALFLWIISPFSGSPSTCPCMIVLYYEKSIQDQERWLFSCANTHSICSIARGLLTRCKSDFVGLQYRPDG